MTAAIGRNGIGRTGIETEIGIEIMIAGMIVINAVMTTAEIKVISVVMIIVATIEISIMRVINVVTITSVVTTTRKKLISQREMVVPVP